MHIQLPNKMYLPRTEQDTDDPLLKALILRMGEEAWYRCLVGRETPTDRARLERIADDLEREGWSGLETG